MAGGEAEQHGQRCAGEVEGHGAPPENEGKVARLQSGAVVAIQSPQKAATDAAEPSMGEWNLEGQLLYFGHLCWLVQEFWWMMLISYPAFLFGFCATLLVAVVVYRRRDGGVSGKVYMEAGPEVLVNLVQLGWLGSSLINCIADLAFADRTDEDIPEYAESLVRLCSGCQDTYDTLIVVVQVGFGITFGLWLASCCYLLVLWMKPPRFVAQGFAFQTCLLEGGWIAFWVLADFANTFDGDGWYVVAMVAWSIHFVLLIMALVLSASQSQITLWDGLCADELESLGTVFCRVDLVIISYVLWSLSSLFWMIAEHFDEGEGWRWAAAATCAVSVIFFVAGYKQARQRGLILYALKDCRVQDEPYSTQIHPLPANVIGH